MFVLARAAGRTALVPYATLRCINKGRWSWRSTVFPAASDRTRWEHPVNRRSLPSSVTYCLSPSSIRPAGPTCCPRRTRSSWSEPRLRRDNLRRNRALSANLTTVHFPRGVKREGRTEARCHHPCCFRESSRVACFLHTRRLLCPLERPRRVWAAIRPARRLPKMFSRPARGQASAMPGQMLRRTRHRR